MQAPFTINDMPGPVSIATWLATIKNYEGYCVPNFPDFEFRVARYLAQDPDRLWSLSEVIRGMQYEWDDFACTRGTVEHLIQDEFLKADVRVVCTEHKDNFWGDQCDDPLCGDTLFAINLAPPFYGLIGDVIPVCHVL